MENENKRIVTNVNTGFIKSAELTIMVREKIVAEILLKPTIDTPES